MRVLSIVPSVLAAGWVLYVSAGGPFDWQVHATWAAIALLSLGCIVASYKHVGDNAHLTRKEKTRWRSRFWYLSLIAVPWYWNTEARRRTGERRHSDEPA